MNQGTVGQTTQRTPCTPNTEVTGQGTGESASASVRYQERYVREIADPLLANAIQSPPSRQGDPDQRLNVRIYVHPDIEGASYGLGPRT